MITHFHHTLFIVAVETFLRCQQCPLQVEAPYVMPLTLRSNIIIARIMPSADQDAPTYDH